MHGRVVTVQVDSRDVGEAVSIYRDSVMPAAQRQKGFRGALLLTDQRTGKGVSVTLWDSEEDLIHGQDSAYYQEQIAKFADILVRTPEQDGYEVSFSSGVITQ